MDPILQDLSSYLATQILRQPSRNISPGEPLISTGLIDSFNLVDLALHVEDAFGVRIEDTELNKETFDTLAQLAQIILDRKK